MSGTVLHEARAGVDTLNLLQMGQITPKEVIAIVQRCGGQHHEVRPHHSASVGVDVHILKRDGWYVKFYFIDPDPTTVFISVHK